MEWRIWLVMEKKIRKRKRGIGALLAALLVFQAAHIDKAAAAASESLPCEKYGVSMSEDTADAGYGDMSTADAGFIDINAMDAYAMPASAAAKIEKADGTIDYVEADRLQDAFEAENSGATVTLLKDVYRTEMLSVRNGTFILDLGGHTIAIDAQNTGVGVVCNGWANLTIRGEGGIAADGGNAIEVANGTLTLEGGTYTGSGDMCAGVYVWSEGAKLSITGKDVKIIGTYAGLGIMNLSTVDLSAGTFTSNNAAVKSGNDRTLGDLLREGYAYFSGSTPITDKLGETELSGTVTVQKCSHMGTMDYQRIEKTTKHRESCRACGYNGEVACSYDYSADPASGTCAGCGSAVKLQLADAGDLVYSGNELRPQARVTLDGEELTSDHYSLAYADNQNAGTASVTAVGQNGCSFTLAAQFEIKPASSVISLKTDKSSYVYGDTVTFEYTIAPQAGRAAVQSRAAAKAGTVDFYCGSTKLNSTEIAVTENTKQTFAYRTAGKGIPIGNQTVTAVFGGSGNLNSTQQSAAVSLSPKPLTAAADSASGSTKKIYDADKGFQNVALALSGVIGSDSVTAAADGMADSADVGEQKTFTASSVTLGGADKDFYVLSADQVSGSVSIAKAKTAISVKSEVSGSAGNREIKLSVTVDNMDNNAVPDGTVSLSGAADGSAQGTVVAQEPLSGAQASGLAEILWQGLADGEYAVRIEYDSTNFEPAVWEAVLDTSRQNQQPLAILNEAAWIYGQPDFVLEADGGSGTGALTFESSDSSVISVSGSTASICGGGWVLITAAKAGDGQYNQAETAVRMHVDKKTLRIKADDKQMTKGGQLPEYTGSCYGIADRDSAEGIFQTRAEAACTADGKTPGSYAIVLSQEAVLNDAAAKNYTITGQEGGVLTVSEQMYTAVVKDGGTGASGGGSYAHGQTVSIYAGTKEGYRFAGWAGSVDFADAYSARTTFVMLECDVTVQAQWRRAEGTSGGSTGSAGGGSGSGAYPGTGISSKKPFLKDSSGREGWDVIRAAAKEAAASPQEKTVYVDMNGTTVVPGSILTDIRGRNVTLVFDLGGGFAWTVHGWDITADSLSDTDLRVRSGAGNIPQDIVDDLAGGPAHWRFRLEHEGEFGFAAVLSINISSLAGTAAGSGFKGCDTGMYANLFYYNPILRRLEYISAGRIGENGTADLRFTHASDYLVVLSAEPMGSTDAPENPPGTQDGVQTEHPQVKSVKLSKTVYTYNGKAKKPSIIAVDTEGRQIPAGSYTVSYKHNKKVGTATAVVTFQGGYCKTVEKTFTIRPAGTTVKKVITGSDGFTVKWAKKTAQTSGYQIQYAKDARFKGNSRQSIFVKKTNMTKKTVKNLKSGKYYVRIRTYKTVKEKGRSTRVYSAWSSAVRVRV